MLGFIGALIAAPIRIVNAPIRAIETLCDTDEDDRILSKPLDVLADEIEDATDEE